MTVAQVISFVNTNLNIISLIVFFVSATASAAAAIFAYKAASAAKLTAQKHRFY